MKTYLGLWLWLGLTLSGQACGTDGLEQVIDKHQVKVWTCHIPNQPLRGFKAVTTVRSSLAGLVGLLMDNGIASQWIYRTERIELLRRDDKAQTFTVRAEIDFLPLKDRDVVIDGSIMQDPKTLTVFIDSRSTPAGQYPESDGFVRMPGMRGRWEFRPLGDGKVEVTMSGHADPGGYLPDFLVNLVVKETPYQTLLGLRRMIAQEKYQRHQIDGIREPL